MSKKITLAIQSPEGQKRVSLAATCKTNELYDLVVKELDLQSAAILLYVDQRRQQLIEPSRLKSVASVGLKHGDRIFMFPKSKTDQVFKTASGEQKATASGSKTPGSSSSSTAKENGFKVPPAVVMEDEVDRILAKQEGKIERGRDSLHCQHNVNSQCVHCIPLDPFDEKYLQEKQIKFLSFHSYLRKISGGMSRGKFAPLRNLCCRVVHTARCSHQPYPQGICSKCQPSAVTLNRQPWRHVDAIMLENSQLVDRFLTFWRESGAQRCGWLYGRYEVYPEVPLSIKAVICTIYEPPQESSRDHIRILPDPKEEMVEELASKLGLVRVGWIFTDLVPLANGKVKNYRGVETHFLSAQEIITAAAYQNQFPNICQLTEEKVFGSKFVTVCVTGNAENEIHMEGYQVSNQCMALVRDGVLVPTKDAPELAYVRESTEDKYVPDVFFMEKDKYGNEIKKLGRPLPVEYLLTDVPVTTPKEPLATFTVLKDRNPFPVENRLLDSSIQDFNSFARYISQFRSAEFFDAISDFHVLIFMATLDIMPLREYMGPLLEAVKTKNREAAREWSYMDHWGQVQALVQATTMS